MATNVFSGARAIFRVNNQQVAFASGCDGSEEIMYEAVDVLDNIEVSEYVPVGYRCTFNCAVFRTIPGTPANGPISTEGPKLPKAGALGSLKSTNIGLFPKSGGTPSEILTNGTMSASITDRLTNITILKVEEVKAQTLNFSITARGIVGQNVTFNAIRFTDEAG